MLSGRLLASDSLDVVTFPPRGERSGYNRFFVSYSGASATDSHRLPFPDTHYLPIQGNRQEIRKQLVIEKSRKKIGEPLLTLISQDSVGIDLEIAPAIPLKRATLH